MVRPICGVKSNALTEVYVTLANKTVECLKDGGRKLNMTFGEVIDHLTVSMAPNSVVMAVMRIIEDMILCTRGLNDADSDRTWELVNLFLDANDSRNKKVNINDFSKELREEITDTERRKVAEEIYKELHQKKKGIANIQKAIDAFHTILDEAEEEPGE